LEQLAALVYLHPAGEEGWEYLRKVGYSLPTC